MGLTGTVHIATARRGDEKEERLRCSAMQCASWMRHFQVGTRRAAAARHWKQSSSTVSISFCTSGPKFCVERDGKCGCQQNVMSAEIGSSETVSDWCTPQFLPVGLTLRQVGSRQVLLCRMLRSHLLELQSIMATTKWRWKCWPSALMISNRFHVVSSTNRVHHIFSNVYLHCAPH